MLRDQTLTGYPSLQLHTKAYPTPSPKMSITSSGSIHNHRGTLYLKFGPMFSAKTTWLNMELTNKADTNFHCLKVVHVDDKRDDVANNSEDGSTHNSTFQRISSKIDVIRVATLAEVDVTDYHVIGVDEAHFYPDLLTTVRDWVENGKHVRVVGLDGDYKMEKFGNILDLIPLADAAEKVSATCLVCLKELKDNQYKGNIFAITGGFTRKIVDDNGNQKDVGGADKYMPVCRYHHANH